MRLICKNLIIVAVFETCRLLPGGASARALFVGNLRKSGGLARDASVVRFTAILHGVADDTALPASAGSVCRFAISGAMAEGMAAEAPRRREGPRTHATHGPPDRDPGDDSGQVLRYLCCGDLLA